MKLSAAVFGTLCVVLDVRILRPVAGQCSCGSPVGVEWRGNGTTTVSGVTAEASISRTYTTDLTFTETFTSTATAVQTTTTCAGTRTGASASPPSVADDCSVTFPAYTITSCSVNCTTAGVSVPLNCSQFPQEAALDAVYSDDCRCLEYGGNPGPVFGSVCREGDGPPQNGTPEPTPPEGDAPTTTPGGGGDAPTTTPGGGGDAPTTTPGGGGDAPTTTPGGGGDAPTTTPGGGGDAPTTSPTDAPDSASSNIFGFWSLLLSGVLVCVASSSAK